MAEKNILDMTDEELAEMPIPEDQVVEEEDEEENAPAEEQASDPDTTGDTDAEEDAEESDTTDEEVDDADLDDESSEEEDDDDSDEEKSEVEDKEVDKKETPDVDYEAEYKKLLAPFRANGRDIQINSVDDAINLMKMGANYNKKMAGLKPALKVVKMLENNELMDEGKLSYLIDLNKKNPDAIKRLIKESGIDPLDIDTEKATDYKPSTYTVSDNEVELDAVLDDIRETETFKDTIEIISNKWDESSKKVLLGTPNIIRTINEHVRLGIYDQIDTVVQKEKMLGRLAGLSDLEAYKQVGDALQAQGAFGKPDVSPTPRANTVQKPTVKAPDPKLKSRKKAASSTRTTPGVKPVDPNFNPLSLSDEEFEKAAEKMFR